MENAKITIVDVAKAAGVSKGTVDRVLHNRGEVSAKSKAKVEKAIAEMGYEPNLYASLLASRKDYLIAMLLPKFHDGEYWGKIAAGFEAGGNQVASLGVKTKVFYYDQYNVRSFDRACKELLDESPSGVVLPPVFKNGTLLFADTLSKKGIPYVYVDSRLEDENCLAYYGMPMYRSGALCANLLTDRCSQKDVDKVVIVRITRDKGSQSDPTVNRRSGFLDYMSQNFPKTEIHNVFINPSSPKEIEATLDEFAKSHPGVRYMVMFNSRVHLIGEFLRSHPVAGRRVIGFDDLEGNVSLLRDGYIDILISQHTENQSLQAVITLADSVIMRKAPQHRDNYMHMDILTRLNLDNY